ncbi:MAG: hypothetical protein QOI02_698, partial [Actinomycetota bacterium]|nr:hypothetical protein [Actinomycetota bacterium]
AGFTDPYTTTSFDSSRFAPPIAQFRANVIDELDEQEFELLLRTAELVVQAQAFSGVRLGQAMRIPSHMVNRMTRALEEVGVISAPGFDGRRQVTADIRSLSSLLTTIMTTRGDGVSATRAVA